MKKTFLASISLASLIAIIYFTSNLPAGHKDANKQLWLLFTGAATHRDKPSVPGFAEADHERDGGEFELVPFLESALSRTSLHDVFTSPAMKTPESMREIDKTNSPGNHITTKMTDIVIMFTILLMTLFFTIKVFE